MNKWKLATCAMGLVIVGYVSYPLYEEVIHPSLSQKEQLCRSMSEVDKDPLIALLGDTPTPTAPEICKDYASYWD